MKNSNTMLNNKKDTMSYDDANILTLYLKDISRIPFHSEKRSLILTRSLLQRRELARKKILKPISVLLLDACKKKRTRLPLIDIIIEGKSVDDRLEKDPAYRIPLISYLFVGSDSP